MAAAVISRAYAAHLAQPIAKAAGDTPDAEEKKRLVEMILGSYDLSPWGFLTYQIEKPLQDAGQTGAESVIQQAFLPEQSVEDVRATITANIELDGFFNQLNDGAADYAHTRAAEMVGKKWVDGMLVDNPDAKWAITDSTRDWLRDAIEKAFTEGATDVELAKSIQEAFAFSKARALSIAHTEVQTACINSMVRGAKAAGATHKKSTTSPDHDIDDFCDDAEDAGEVPIDYDYGGGLLWPLYHPNCWCGISFYVRKQKSVTVSP